MSHSWKSLSKPLSFTLLILILITAVVSILLNNFLEASKGKIEQNASNLFKHKISIERISFIPPNFVSLNNITVQETNPAGKSQPVFIARIKCMFSIFMLIFKRDIVITRMSLDKSDLNYPFIKENREDILEGIRYLAQDYPLKIKIRKARLNMPQPGRHTQWITLDARLAIVPNQSLFSSGSIGLEGFSNIAKLTSLDYSCRLFLTKNGLIIDNLEFKTSPFQLKLWGRLADNVLSINGSSSLSNFPVLDIHDLACVIKFEFPHIQIGNLNFSLQNMPFGLNGSISLSDPPRLNLTFSSFPNQPAAIRADNPEAFDIKAAGNLEKSKFNGTTSVDFIRRTKTKSSLERLEMMFKNLTLFNASDEKMQMAFDQSTLSYISGNNTYNILLEDFIALMQLENQVMKFFKINSLIYDGFLEGRGILDMSRIPLRSSFDVSINGVSANKLHNLITYCSKIYGNLSSQIHYCSHPNSTLSGKLVISAGLLDNIIFFEWVADFLTIPSLSRINFNTLSAEFLINDQGASLESIRLKSKDVNFQGYFTLQENDLVSSKLSLVFAKEFLRDSPKLRRLINYLDKDAASISFHFQVSGLFQAMNFKWLKSDFKQTLQNLLPRQMEKRLEGEIEKIIESISAQ